MLLNNILLLIINTIAGVLGGVMLLRFWMQAVQVRPPYPLADFVFKLTNWLVKPLRRVLPGTGGFDWASLVGAYLIYLAVTAVVLFIALGDVPVQFALFGALMRLATSICYGFIILLIVGAILSWVNPHAPAAPFIYALTAPLLRPFRRVIPPMGGIDLTPMVVMLLIYIVLMVLSSFGAQYQMHMLLQS